MSDMFEIVGRRDLPALQQALRDDPTAAAARNADGASLLSFAHYMSWKEAVATIRAALPAVTPHEAIISGEADGLRAAIASGWDANERSADGFAPLALAAFFGREEIFDLLLPLVSDVNERSHNGQQVAALHAATASNSRGIVEKLLRAGADPNLQQQDGFRPLHTAAQHGDAVMTALLLLFGADPALASGNGKAAADFAEAGGHGWLAARLRAVAQRVV